MSSRSTANTTQVNQMQFSLIMWYWDIMRLCLHRLDGWQETSDVNYTMTLNTFNNYTQHAIHYTAFESTSNSVINDSKDWQLQTIVFKIKWSRYIVHSYLIFFHNFFIFMARWIKEPLHQGVLIWEVLIWKDRTVWWCYLGCFKLFTLLASIFIVVLVSCLMQGQALEKKALVHTV